MSDREIVDPEQAAQKGPAQDYAALLDLRRDTSLARAALEREKAALRRVRMLQRIWWPALIALGFALGFAVAEWIIDPVTIIVAEDSGISV